MTVGERIYRLRKAQGLTQEKLATEIGVTFQAVSSWERDEYLPDVNHLEPLSKALHTTIGTLLDDEVEKDYNYRIKFFDENDMYTRVQTTAIRDGLMMTLKVLPLVRELYENQKRKTETDVPYIVHPLTMCCHAISLGLINDEMMCTILLHSVFEICELPKEKLLVNNVVINALELLTKKFDPLKSSSENQGNYYNKIYMSKLAMIVKLFDRCNSISNMAQGFSKTKMSQYISETEKYIMPMCDILPQLDSSYKDCCFSIKYQLLSTMETVKRLL